MQYEIALPREESEHDNVVQLRGAASTVSAEAATTPAVPDPAEGPAAERAGLRDQLQPVVERLAAGWSVAWVGEGVFGLRPRPVADLARQFWTDPKPYIRDALILRVPYAIYGTPVIALSAAAHLLLLIISYPALLTASILLALFISLFV